MSELSSPSEDATVVAIHSLARQYAERIVEPDVAADVAQDVTIACLMKLRAGRLPSSSPALTALVRRMVRDRAIDWWRSCDRRGERDGQHHSESCASTNAWMSPDAVIEDAELWAFYVRTRDSMPKMCRQVYVMLREEGASYQQVAKRLGIAVATVRWHLVAAQRRFRDALKERDGPADRRHQ
jgi:RNA polymerase sigma factor (sigma-70 family)